jgi:hypothetical protein
MMKLWSKVKWVALLLNVVVLIVLFSSMMRDLPTVAAYFFFALLIPTFFTVGVAITFLLRSTSKQVDTTLGLSLVMLMLSIVVWLLWFPPDLRPTIQVSIPADYAGNIYYFRPDAGDVQLTVDAYGCIYIPPAVAEGKRFEIYYGDDQITENQLIGMIEVYTAQVADGAESQKISFASFYVENTSGGVRIGKAKDPLEAFHMMHRQGVLSTQLMVGKE